jgi:ABC-type multidrug transport system ATPase subunit
MEMNLKLIFLIQGKSTLMALIGKRGIGGTKSGKITYGNATSKNRRVAYCPPVDVHIEYFTVMQSLFYSCLLRNSSKMLSNQQCSNECLRVATAVGLEKSLDKVVGSNTVKGTSRGERRLLSIATELLGIPFALCLDDPMSGTHGFIPSRSFMHHRINLLHIFSAGLDSEAAVRVANVLSSLASQEKKTVLCSLHHPARELLYQSNWQDILFLSAGSIVYCGPIHILESYLIKLSLYDYPLDMPAEYVLSPVEYVLELLGKPDSSEMLCIHWSSPSNKQWVDLQSIDIAVSIDMTPVNPDEKEDKEGIDDIPHRVWYEIVVVSVRHFMYKLYALEGGMRTIIGRYILSGILFGITFQNTGKQMHSLDSVFKYEDANFYNASYNMMSIEFCMCCFIVVSCCLSIAEMYHMREFFEQEAVSIAFINPLPSSLLPPINLLHTCSLC